MTAKSGDTGGDAGIVDVALGRPHAGFFPGGSVAAVATIENTFGCSQVSPQMVSNC
ncbi:hypothetical protein [Mycobacterium colombiense]|uniref:hypothetical protein n=1 Tax=Mycobacterium colombiense TaxID=339268 RepID=UPI000AA281F8|nr:hypothetical protein [Mycobacterium colombiense]